MARQIDGPVDQIMSLGNLKGKYEMFGWEVFECDGNDFEELVPTLNQAINAKGNGKPKLICMKTEMGKGVDFMEGSHKWHGIPPNDEDLANALNQLEETLGDY